MWECTIGTGRHRVTLQALDSGDGWLCLLTGGERPHIGGMVMALPRPSLSGKGQSCDLFITPAPGHKDTDVAAPLAKRLCLATNAVTVVSGGIHVDAATPEDIAVMEENCRAAADTLLSQLSLPTQKG